MLGGINKKHIHRSRAEHVDQEREDCEDYHGVEETCHEEKL
jgi:hypothetical protein